jgi:hypothetical protein
LFLETSLNPETLEIKARTDTNGTLENSSTTDIPQYRTVKLSFDAPKVPGCAKYCPVLLPVPVITTITALVIEANAPWFVLH